MRSGIIDQAQLYTQQVMIFQIRIKYQILKMSQEEVSASNSNNGATLRDANQEDIWLCKTLLDT
jgi:hypothetical protein